MKMFIEIEVEIDGNIHDGDPGDRDNPPSPAYVEDIAVYLTRKDKNGNNEELDITAWLDKGTIENVEDEIMNAAIEHMQGMRENAMELKAELARENRHLESEE